MHTNYNPYAQHEVEEFNKFIAKLKVYEEEIVKANQRLTEFIKEELPLILRHHAGNRHMLKMHVSQTKQVLQNNGNERAQVFNATWQMEMANIEGQRAQYFAAEATRKQKERTEKLERASVDYDPSNGQHFYYKIVARQVNGVTKPERVKTLLPSHHPWAMDFALVGK